MRLIEKITLTMLKYLNPEVAHFLVLRLLRYKLFPKVKTHNSRLLEVNLASLNLKNPIGLAAGFDKNAEAINTLPKIGFGFLEVGGVTPLPQYGNEKPRVFRLQRDRAIINRLGFNNKGMDYVKKKLILRDCSIPIGINLGANKDSGNRIKDYSKVLMACGDFVDFATLNISSPNTKNLRELQTTKNLKALLSELEKARAKLIKVIPIFVKISPDLSDQSLTELIEVIRHSTVDGIIATNTTVSRDNLISKSKLEIGGLSGKPLKKVSTEIIAKISHATNGKLPIIGVGGVCSAEDAYEKICAGASALQLYTGLVYNGFSVINEICLELEKLLLADGHNSIASAVGSKRNDWL